MRSLSSLTAHTKFQTNLRMLLPYLLFYSRHTYFMDQQYDEIHSFNLTRFLLEVPTRHLSCGKFTIIFS